MPELLEPDYSCDLEEEEARPEPASIVIFGATGDLAARKIFPALYNLTRTGRLHPESRILGLGRRHLDDASFRASLADAVSRFSHSGFAPELWAGLEARIEYLEGELQDEALYDRLAKRLASPGMPETTLFYLAVGPEQFGPTAAFLGRAGLGSAGGSAGASGGSAGLGGSGSARIPIRRLVVEKPFGKDRGSAFLLSRQLQAAFAESDIFRIDHYLGKETVQNLLYLRFANSVFEPLWNRNYIEKVEIEVLETGGIGTRGGYYDGAGAARDMLQNHLVQLLCLTAMEPPASLDPESIRDEKVKVLRALPRYTPEELLARSVRGQYRAGPGAEGRGIPDYRAEAKVAPGSETETYVALKLELDNWRFAGVPFLLRTGKALDRQVSEIRVHFRKPPAALFAGTCRDRLPANGLVLRVQPDEGLWLFFNAKVPGAARVSRKRLRFSYRDAGDYFPEAYERLIADALSGDSTLFIRSDEAEEAWRLVDALEAAWAAPGAPPPLPYAAGSAPLPTPGEELG